MLGQIVAQIHAGCGHVLSSQPLATHIRSNGTQRPDKVGAVNVSGRFPCYKEEPLHGVSRMLSMIC